MSPAYTLYIVIRTTASRDQMNLYTPDIRLRSQVITTSFILLPILYLYFTEIIKYLNGNAYCFSRDSFMIAQSEVKLGLH